MERGGASIWGNRCLGLPIGCHLQWGEPEGEVQPAGEQDARILAKPRHSVASAFRWMVLTVWVLKSSGSVWWGRQQTKRFGYVISITIQPFRTVSHFVK